MTPAGAMSRFFTANIRHPHTAGPMPGLAADFSACCEHAALRSHDPPFNVASYIKACSRSARRRALTSSWRPYGTVRFADHRPVRRQPGGGRSPASVW